MAKVVVTNLRHKVGDKEILKNISFTIEENQKVGILGNNRSGKTTLLKMLAGILPNNNTIVYGFGYFNSKRNRKDLKNIGCVFVDEFPFLFDDVYHELLFPLENLCYPTEEISSRIQSLVRSFGVSYLLDKKIVDLTEEEKSLVHLFLALLHRPEILLLDDPFVRMSPSFKKQVMKHFLAFLQQNPMTVIFATQNPEDLLFTDYIYVLNEGEIAMQGDTMEILKEDVRLKKLGISLPFMVDLSLMLEFYEILDDVYLNMEDLVMKLWN